MSEFIPYIAPVSWEDALMSGDMQGLNEEEKEIAERVTNAFGAAEYRGPTRMGVFMGELQQICEYLLSFPWSAEDE